MSSMRKTSRRAQGVPRGSLRGGVGIVVCAACSLQHPAAPGGGDAGVFGLDDATAQDSRVPARDARDDGAPPLDTQSRADGSSGDVSVEAPRCPPSLAWCDGACVDTGTDVAHCGACANRCAGRASCVDGACVAAPTCVGGEALDLTVEDRTYRVHTFAAVGSWTLSCTGALSVEYLVVGGGGGGGGGNRCGGGGGAGGHRTGEVRVMGEVPVRVGGGGAVGADGGDSALGEIVARGGGAGGNGAMFSGGPGNPGGSGGGAGFKYYDGGGGTPPQGHPGGNSRRGNYTAGGGGGGAGSPGLPGGGSDEGVGGAGGAGLASEITGTRVMRAGGGAGRGEARNGAAGAGGGGGVRSAGVANTGGGGGADAAGGAGVVVVRYRL